MAVAEQSRATREIRGQLTDVPGARDPVPALPAVAGTAEELVQRNYCQTKGNMIMSTYSLLILGENLEL